MSDILGWFHHTYVMPSDASWVLVYTMEGNLNFCYAVLIARDLVQPYALG